MNNWMESDFWNKRLFDIEKTVNFDSVLHGDCVIFKDGSFTFLGDYNDINKYSDLFILPIYKKLNMTDVNKISYVMKYINQERSIIWINISDDNGIFIPTDEMITDEQKQTITALKDVVRKHQSGKKK